MPLTFDRPDWIELRVPAARFESARQFYGHLLTLEADGPPAVFRAGARRVQLRGLVRDDDPRGAVIDLQVPDLLAAADTLMELGAVWLEDLCALPGGGWTTDLIDPYKAIWRLSEAPGSHREGAMQAYAGRYMARISHPGQPKSRAVPSLQSGRFGPCAQRDDLDPEAALGPPHLYAFGGDRVPGRATRVWRYEADDSTLVELNWPLGEPVQVFADPPDLFRALTVLGLPLEGWTTLPGAEPPSAVPGPFRLMRQDDSGNSFEIKQLQSDHAAQRWLAVYEARAHKQIYWLERVP